AVVNDEPDPIARLEITSWLRGPHLTVRPFVVATSHGELPVQGAPLLAAIPRITTQLDVGEHADLMMPGDRAVVAGHSMASNAPFRGLDAPDIAMIAAPDARRYRFSDVTLVVWRPAVAYLAILIAVALPYLSIVLT
ncbi:MAG TPA: hypothetical protein VIV40_02820, partial [Kofleriaceae bacterium]